MTGTITWTDDEGVVHEKEFSEEDTWHINSLGTYNGVWVRIENPYKD